VWPALMAVTMSVRSTTVANALPHNPLVARPTHPTRHMLNLCCTADGTAVVPQRPLAGFQRAATGAAAGMIAGMIRPCHQSQVRGIVVEPVAVNMVDNFIGFEVAIQRAFKHKAVLEDIAFVIRARVIGGVNHAVAAIGDVRAAAPVRRPLAALRQPSASERTILASTLLNLRGPSKELATTLLTDETCASLRGRILIGHRSQSLRCRAGGVPSTARLSVVHDQILPHLNTEGDTHG
jgi:hypothetical protein